MTSTMGPAWMKRVHVPQGFPTPSTDAAPAALFLALFFFTSIGHATIFIRNKKRGHKFLFNSFCAGFCMVRVITNSLRLAWMYNIENRGLAVASTIFVALGVLVLFILNLLFAQRILRGLHPHIGWNKKLSKVFLAILLIIIPLVVMLVIALTQSFFTTDINTAHIDLDMERGGSTYFLFLAFLPMPIVLFALFYPKMSEPDHFGKRTFLHKSIVVLVASALLTLGAGFRGGTSFYTFKPEWAMSPPWWNEKWCFYFFNFTVEIIVVWMYLALRIDLIFHVPDGSHGPGSYSSKLAEFQEKEEIATKALDTESLDSASSASEPPHTPVEFRTTESFHV